MTGKRTAIQFYEQNLTIKSQKHQRKSISNIDEKYKNENNVHSPLNDSQDFERFISEVEGRFAELPKRKKFKKPSKSTPKNNNNYKTNITDKNAILNISNDFVEINDENLNESWQSDDFTSEQVESSFEEIQFNKTPCTCKTKNLAKTTCIKNMKENQNLNEIRSTEFEKKLEKILFQTSNENSEESSVISVTEVSEEKLNINDLSISQKLIKSEIQNSTDHNESKNEEMLKIKNKNDLVSVKDNRKNEIPNIIASNNIEDRKSNKEKHLEAIKVIVIDDSSEEDNLKDCSIPQIKVIDEAIDKICLNETNTEIIVKADESNVDNSIITVSSDDSIEDVKIVLETTNPEKSFAEKCHEISKKLLEKNFRDPIILNEYSDRFSSPITKSFEDSIIDDIRNMFETTNNLEKSIVEKYDTSIKLLEDNFRDQMSQIETSDGYSSALSTSFEDSIIEDVKNIFKSTNQENLDIKLLEDKFRDQISQIETSDGYSSAISTSFEDSIIDDIKNIFETNNLEKSLAKKYFDTSIKLLEDNFGDQSSSNKTPERVSSPAAKIICRNKNYIKYINLEGRKCFNNEKFIVNVNETLNENCNFNQTPKKNDKIYNKIIFQKHSSKKKLNNGRTSCNVYYTAKSRLIMNEENDLENLAEKILFATYVVNLFFYNRF